jgi:sugar fermentation stimulation protein A
VKYPSPLVEGRFVRRYKRFFADVELEGLGVVTAHCANTGAMTACVEPGSPVRLSPSDNPRRKLAWSLEQSCVGGQWILVHTGRPNRIVREAIVAGRVPELSGYATVESEKRAGESRLDLLLSHPGRRSAWVEVKNVTMLDPDGVLRFPDAVTARGARHLEALKTQVEDGDRAVLFLHVGHSGGARVEPARAVDPAWAMALERAMEAGVEVIAHRVRLSADQAVLAEAIPFTL